MKPMERGIDFTALASQYRLIPASPAYEEVMAAVSRLRSAQRSGTPLATRSADAEALREFRVLVERNVTMLAGALVLGFVIGLAKERRRAEGISVGLDLLSRAYGLSAVTSERAVAELITKIGNEARTFLNDVGITTRLVLEPPANSVMSPPGFAQYVRSECEGYASGITFSDDVLVRVRDAAWTSCVKRLAGESRDPEIAELFAASSERITSALVPFDIDDLHIRHLSSIAVLSYDESKPGDVAFTPAVVGDLALTALGFPPAESLRPVVGDQRLLQAVSRALSRVVRPGGPDAIVWAVPDPASSLLDEFNLADGSIACLGVDQALFRKNRREVRQLLDRISRHQQLTVVIEVAPGETDASVETRVREVRKVTNPSIGPVNVPSWRGPAGPVYVYPHRQEVVRTPGLTAPKRLEQIVRAAHPDKSAV